MKSISVTELEAHLPETLDEVTAGEGLLVMKSGKVVAQILPPRDEELLERLPNGCVVRRGTGRLPEGFWDRQRPADPSGSVRAAVAEQRSQGW